MARVYTEEQRERKRLYAAEYRKNNPEKAKAAIAKWRLANPEKVNPKEAAKLRVRDKARANAVAAAYYERKKDVIKERVAAYKKENPEATRAARQNYRARKQANGGRISSGVVEKLMFLQKCKCVSCHKSLANGYEVDHIVALARGGKHEDANIQLLCPTCNKKKSAKDPIQFMQQRGYLL